MSGSANHFPGDSLASFHPRLASWFSRRLGSPTPFQAEAWAAIREGGDTLLAAPTGSGKTLAAFLVALDSLWRRAESGDLPAGTEVLYVSPLKALSNDVEKNLNRPLREISESFFQDHLHEAAVKVALRTGDTPASERAAMLRKPPHILVTTPESLYLLLTSRKAREMLRGIRTVILDEVHALLPDRRGAHLMLSLQRLESLCGRRPQRIGLSATQKPMASVARYLTGCDDSGQARPCALVDAGLRRDMDVDLVLPGSDLQAVMALEVWEDVYRLLETHILAHRTTLVFVNTRRMAERVAHRLGQSLGEENVAAHHGSLSRERRFRAETALKEGRLKVMVATASLELGIDIGEIDLCVQLGGPKTLSSFIQRMGRSGHFIGGKPKGRLFPLTRDELVEAAALLRCLRQGELDTLILPRKPLDILAQQIVAEVACGECEEGGLFALFRRAAVYADLTAKEYADVVSMLSEGFTTRRGRTGAFIHRDGVHGRLRPRRGARLAAITCGGAIPDTFDIEVRLDPGDLLLGSVNEDFAIESLPGDVFQLGNRSWRILRVEAHAMRVADAGEEPPGIPFWLGEAPARSAEFSEAVSVIRSGVETALGESALLRDRIDQQGDAAEAPWRSPALAWLNRECGLSGESAAARQIVDYLASAQLALGHLPTSNRLILERFFDDGGATHLVLHSPLGGRLNRALGLALRKRFCRKFNFELQAAATEDAVILSLGASHSFPLAEVWQYLNAESVEPILVQALLAAPMFEVRWRWNATRALAILRMRGGKRTPPPIQRLQAQDLAALVFPDSIACPENLGGDREIPDHPLVNQTLGDCLHEAMDSDALQALLRRMAAGAVELFEVDAREPSPMAEAVLSARPYAFLDDAPLEERRTRAVKIKSDWSPARADALARLDPVAIARVQNEAAPSWRDADELHDALLIAGFLSQAEILGPAAAFLVPPGGSCDGETTQTLLRELALAGRAQSLVLPDKTDLWYATERQGEILAAFNRAPAATAQTPEDAYRELIRGRLEISGPVTLEALVQTTLWNRAQVQSAFLALETEGFAFRGDFPRALHADGEKPASNGLFSAWCDRHLLARIHRYARNTVRQRSEPVSSSAFQHFLFAWHRILPQDRREGPEGLAQALAQLEGYAAPLAAWEGDILPSRVAGYRPEWLEGLLLSGRFTWRRPPPADAERPMGRAPFHKGMPIAFYPSDKVPYPPLPPTDILGHAAPVMQHLQKYGAAFWREIARSGPLPLDAIREGLKEAVARGWVAGDGMAGLRALLKGQGQATSSRHRRIPAPDLLDKAGRWFLTGHAENSKTESDREELVMACARRLLQRFGVVFRRIADTENDSLPWRELLRALRLLEDRGEIRGGRFVIGYSGEQFALPEAAEILRKTHFSPLPQVLSALDPTHKQGHLSPGPRLPAQGQNRLLFIAGEAVAGLEGQEIRFFKDVSLDEGERWRNSLFSFSWTDPKKNLASPVKAS